jgi:hypothetical protein
MACSIGSLVITDTCKGLCLCRSAAALLFFILQKISTTKCNSLKMYYYTKYQKTLFTLYHLVVIIWPRHPNNLQGGILYLRGFVWFHRKQRLSP